PPRGQPARLAVLPAVPGRLRAVPHLAHDLRVLDEPDRHQPRRHQDRFRRPGELRRGVLGSVRVEQPAEHGVVHRALRGPAGDRRARVRGAGEHRAARAVVLAAVLLHAVPAGLHRGLPVLGVDVQPAAGPDQHGAGLVRHHRAGVAAGPEPRDARRGRDDRVVDRRVQLPAVPHGAAEHPRPPLRGGGAGRRRALAPAGLDHPPAAGAHHRAGARAADARLAEGVRPDLPDDRRRARGRYPADPAVRLRGRLHRLPPGLRLGHLVHLLLPDHHRLHRVHGDLVPTEREGMTAAANPITPTRPAEAAAAHVATPTPSRRRRKLDPFRVLAFVILAVLALAWLVPVAWAVLTSLKTEAEAAAMPVTLVPDSGFTLSAYKETLSEGKVPRWAWNSLLTSSLVTAITVVISALAGYALSRMTFTGRRLIITLTVASIMIPSQILIVPLFKLMLSLDLVDTYWGIILPQVVAAPMVFILMKFFDQIPKELEEAAL